MAVKSEPKYDSDEVNLGYLKKVIAELKQINSTTQETLEKVFTKNYGSQPNTPYYAGSTWTTENYIYRCIKDRLIGPFSIDDWVKIYDRNREMLFDNNFLFLSQVELIEQPDDHKIETYYLLDDPSSDWDTSLSKSSHEGDFWRKRTELGFADYVYTKMATNPVTYEWIETTLPITFYNTITNKKSIFFEQPIEYVQGDIWITFINSNKKYLVAIKDSDVFSESDWEELKEELSLKNIETYYIVTTEINKQLENLDLEVEKKIEETNNSIITYVKTSYTEKETTTELTQKIDANGNAIEEMYGDRTSETDVKSLTALSIGQEELKSTVETVKNDLNGLSTTVSQNNSEIQASIRRLEENGVEKLKNTLVTININGIQVATNLSKISTIVTNDTFAIKDNTGNYLAYFGYDEKEKKSKAEMDNLTIHNYFTAGYHRTEKFITEDKEKRTGCFWAGGVING